MQNLESICRIPDGLWELELSNLRLAWENIEMRSADFGMRNCQPAVFSCQWAVVIERGTAGMMFEACENENVRIDATA